MQATNSWRGRVAVVNDDPALLAIFEEALQEEGFAVHTHLQTEGLEECVRDHQPELLILDLRLGDKEGGLGLLERLREDPATVSLPVIVSSGDALALESLQAQGERVLVKPFELDHLVDAVVAALAAGRAGAPGA